MAKFITPKTEAEALVLLDNWQQAKDYLTTIKVEEMELRTILVDFFFDDQTEGTKTKDLPQDWKLKAAFKYNRTIDIAVLKSVLEELPEGTEDKIINYKPELKLKNYKNMTEEDKNTFDAALTTKPGSPALTLIAPKETK